MGQVAVVTVVVKTDGPFGPVAPVEHVLQDGGVGVVVQAEVGLRQVEGRQAQPRRKTPLLEVGVPYLETTSHHVEETGGDGRLVETVVRLGAPVTVAGHSYGV